jgi:hypothetical protein
VVIVHAQTHAFTKAVERRRVANSRVVRISVAPGYEGSIGPVVTVADPVANAHVIVIAVEEVTKGNACWYSVARTVWRWMIVGCKTGVGRVEAVKNTAIFVGVAVTVAQVVEAGRAEPVARVTATHPAMK